MAPSSNLTSIKEVQSKHELPPCWFDAILYGAEYLDRNQQPERPDDLTVENYFKYRDNWSGFINKELVKENLESQIKALEEQIKNINMSITSLKEQLDNA